jgi:hypothetical protein
MTIMRRSEQDVNQRQRIAEEIDKIHLILVGTFGFVEGPGSEEVLRCILLNIDELELLRGSVQLQQVGKRYPILDHHVSVTRSGRKAAAKLDKLVLERIEALVDAAMDIEEGLAEDTLGEPTKELLALHRHIVWIRNKYTDRQYIQKGV